MVATDLFHTPTTRYADIVLPAASEFEQEDLTGSPQVGYLLHMPKVIDPPGEARSDLDIFASLAFFIKSGHWRCDVKRDFIDRC